jgi:ketosteroid isomerase-like protein
MKITINVFLAAIVASTAICSVAGFARAGTADEAEIKALEARFVKALEAKDVDAIMANYAPGDSIVVFDVIPPRQYVGSDAYKKDWQGFLAGCQGPVKVEMTDLSVVADGKLGYGHSIQRLRCTTPKGGTQDLTVRVTDGYQKRGGKWLIAHEHISVPVDLATSKADLTSKP